MARWKLRSVDRTLRTSLTIFRVQTMTSSFPVYPADNSSLRLCSSQSSGVTLTHPKHTMTFEEYRKLKKAMKVRSRIAGMPMGLFGVTLSSYINVSLNPRMFEMSPEEIQPILGLDPIVFSGICGVVSGILGYFVGGAIFSAAWRLVSKKQFQELQQRDVEFLQRLQKHRFSEINKYDDDYYGDKILTLSDYRQWIRNQQKKKSGLKTQTATIKSQSKES